MSKIKTPDSDKVTSNSTGGLHMDILEATADAAVSPWSPTSMRFEDPATKSMRAFLAASANAAIDGTDDEK